MCHSDRDTFKQELMATQKTIQGLSKPVKFSEELADFELADDLKKYIADISAGAKTFGDSTAEERALNKANLTQFSQDVKGNLK